MDKTRPLGTLIRLSFFLLGFVLAFCFVLYVYGATWDKPDEQATKEKYYHIPKPKWDSPDKAFDEKDLQEKPPKGWYNYDNLNDFIIPDDWPYWVKKRFQKLMRDKEIPAKDKELVRRWARPPLEVNTKWIDSKSDRTKGFILAKADKFNHFTVFKIDPSDGIVEQNFRGKAKIYGLDEDKQYRIYCFDARGYVGGSVTALADKYIRIHDPTASDPSFSTKEGTIYSRTHGLKVVEDPDRDTWVAAQKPRLVGTTYYFPKLYAFNADGALTWDHLPAIGYDSPDDYLADLILKSNGDVIYGSGRVPFKETGTVVDGCNVYEYVLNDPSNGYIVKINKQGNIVWEQTDPGGEVYSLLERDDGGFVYCGVYWATGEGAYDARVWKISDSGVTETWGNGNGYGYFELMTDPYDIELNSSGHYFVVGPAR
jgi:hypothetical protein